MNMRGAVAVSGVFCLVGVLGGTVPAQRPASSGMTARVEMSGPAGATSSSRHRTAEKTEGTSSRADKSQPVSFPPLDDDTFRLLYVQMPSFRKEDITETVPFLVTGDLRGKLGPCGCPKLKMGGLAWRKGFEAQMERVSGRPVHGLDFGGSLSAAGQVDVLSLAQGEYVLRALRQSGIEVMNLAARDLPVVKLLMKLESRKLEPPVADVGTREPLGKLQQVLPVTAPLVTALLEEHQATLPEDVLAGSLVESPEVKLLEGLVSANLRHPGLPVWRPVRTARGLCLVTGITELSATSRIVAEGDFEVLEPEAGLRQALEGQRETVPAETIAGYIVLVWGGEALAQKAAALLAELAPAHPGAVFYGNGKVDQEPKVLEEGKRPVFPMYREGKIAGLAHVLPDRVVGVPVLLTDQFELRGQPGMAWKALERSGESFRDALLRAVFSRNSGQLP